MQCCSYPMAVNARLQCTFGEISSVVRGVSASSVRVNPQAPAPVSDDSCLVGRRDSSARRARMPSSVIKQVTFPIDVMFDAAVRDHDVDEVASLLKTLAPPSSTRVRSASDPSAYDLGSGARWLCPLNVNAHCRKLGLTALHLCCLQGRLDCVRALAAGGANCDARDKRGWTPLHVAAWAGHADVVEVLLAYGASCDEKANGGLRPVDVAKKEEAARLLREAARVGHTPTPASNAERLGTRSRSISVTF